MANILKIKLALFFDGVPCLTIESTSFSANPETETFARTRVLILKTLQYV